MDAEELAHYAEVLLSMKEYEGYVWREAFRKKQHLKQLSEKHARRLPKETAKENIISLMRYAKANQVFWDEVIAMQTSFGPEVNLPAQINVKEPMKTPYRHYSKLKSTLHQLVRDWALEGAEERERCYKPILDEIKRVLPVNEKNRWMIDKSAREPDVYTIHPWIDNPSNVMSFEDFGRAVTIPDVSPDSLLDLTSGIYYSRPPREFLEVYADEQETWDCIVTCFFIDAAPNVIEFIEAFERLLKPGGVWINLGPLLYHWQNGSGEEDDRYDQSIELTYEEIKHVAESYDFKFVHEERKECLYTCNPTSMLRSTFNCAFFTAIKGTPLESVPAKKGKSNK
ncbi:unnamed protein product [Aphanomyces euteiches]